MTEAESPTNASKGAEKSAVRVMVRVRPFDRRELGDNPNEYPMSVVMMTEKQVTLLDADGAVQDTFDFHETFWSIPESQKQFCTASFSDQEAVFQRTGVPAVDNALKGYHTCIFAYGQTGSGKTHTMLGSPEDPGVAPRLVHYLYDSLERVRQEKHQWEWTVEVSFMEIYNERVKDLLAGEARLLDPLPSVKSSRALRKRESRNKLDSPHGLRRKSSLRAGKNTRRKSSMGLGEKEEYTDCKVRTSPSSGIFVEGLTRLSTVHGVCTAEDVISVMRVGMDHRSTAATAMNDTSSRSHAVFQICLSAKNPIAGTSRYSHINIVDLAGSERIKMSKVEGQSLNEATKINLSLSTLRRVIDILIENSMKKKNQPKTHIPYRESTLTWILSESLGGNSKTMMIATVSPAESNREDTLNTLRYALKAKAIVNTVKVNEQKSSVMLSAMQREMELLRKKLTDPTVLKSEEEIEEMKAQQAFLEEEYAKNVADIKEAERKIKEWEAEVKKKEKEAQKAAQEVQVLMAQNLDQKHAKEKEVHEEAEKVMHKKKSILKQVEKQTEETHKTLQKAVEERREGEENVREADTAVKLTGHDKVYQRKDLFREAFKKAFSIQKTEVRKLQQEKDLQKTADLAARMSMQIEMAGQDARDMELMNMRQSIQLTKVEKEVAREEKRFEAAIIAKRQELAALEKSTKHLDVECDAAREEAVRLKEEYKERLNNSPKGSPESRRYKEGLKIERLQQEVGDRRLQLRQQESTLASTHTSLEILQKLVEDLTAENAGMKVKVQGTREKVRETRTFNADQRKQYAQTDHELNDVVMLTSTTHDEVDVMTAKKLALKAEAEKLDAKHNELRHFASVRFFPNGNGPHIAAPVFVQEEIPETTPQTDAHRAWTGHGYRYKRQTSPVRRQSTYTNTLKTPPATGASGSSSPYRRYETHTTTHQSPTRVKFTRSESAPHQPPHVTPPKSVRQPVV